MDKAKWSVQAACADHSELSVGCVLIALGFAMPAFFTVQNFGIPELLHDALYWNDRLDLIVAALHLVILNSLRAFPHYLGVYMAAESLEFRWRDKNLWGLNALLVVGVLQLTYWGIEAVYQIHYDFGLPALAVTGLVILIEKMDYKYIALSKKVMLLMMGLVAFQFLDVMPAASGLPVGRGESSLNIKMASVVVDGVDELNTLAISGFVLFLGIAGLFFALLRDENTLREMAALREQNEVIRTQAQLQELQNRTYREMQHLVHDLKSPLMVVQTLAGVIKMSCEAQKMEQTLPLLERIERAVDQMSQMISEILYEDKANPITVEQLMNRVMAQLSIEPYAPNIQLELQPETAKSVVRVNSVLFPRALVNLVQNSVKAIPEGRKKQITLKAERRDGWVWFQVRDNGRGIATERQRDVWERGYSGTSSSGLGLSFVRSVVERVGGRIEMESEVDVGTSISLIIPEGGASCEP